MSFFIRKYIKNIKPAGIAKAIMKISKYVNINNIDDPPSISIIYFFYSFQCLLDIITC